MLPSQILGCFSLLVNAEKYFSRTDTQVAHCYCLLFRFHSATWGNIVITNTLIKQLSIVCTYLISRTRALIAQIYYAKIDVSSSIEPRCRAKIYGDRLWHSNFMFIASRRWMLRASWISKVWIFRESQKTRNKSFSGSIDCASQWESPKIHELGFCVLPAYKGS